jgi:hypothetical protein
MTLPIGAEFGQLAFSTSEFTGPGSGDDLLGGDPEGAPDPSGPTEPSHARPGGDYPESGEDEDLDAEEHGETDARLSVAEQRAKDAEERAKQAERLREKQEAKLDELTARLLANEDKRLEREAAPKPTVADKPPHSEAELQKILDTGSAKEYHEFVQENTEWKLEKMRADILQQARNEAKGSRLEQTMADRLKVPPGQEAIVSERMQFWLNNGAESREIAVLLAKADLGIEHLKPRENKDVRQESNDRQARGEPQVRRGRSTGVPRTGTDLGNPDNIPEHIKRGLIRAELDKKYLVRGKTRHDEKVRREGLRRVMARYSDLNEE